MYWINAAYGLTNMMKLVEKLRDDGMTIIYISHRLDEIFRLSDTITVLRDGEYVKTLQTKESNVNELITLMVGRELSGSYPTRKNCIQEEEILRLEHVTGNGNSDISFSLKKGEILGLGGLVGAGRTELAQIIFGIVRKTKGKIYYHGKEIDPKSPREAIDLIEAEGINTIGLLLDNNCFTTLAFVDLASNGERIFSFARKPGADTQLETKELPKQLLQNTKIFHIGSLSLTTDPARESTYFAMKIAKQAGAWISYDPNYRANLWPSQNAAVSEMRNMLRYSDMVKVSDEECFLLTGEKNFEKGAQKILDEGATFVAVTLGKDGALIASKEGTRIVKGFAVESVDTTGAGDSFWGGLVSSFIESGKQLCDITLREWEEFATVRNAVAALCVGKRGGIPSIPTAESVNEFLKTKIQSL